MNDSFLDIIGLAHFKNKMDALNENIFVSKEYFNDVMSLGFVTTGMLTFEPSSEIGFELSSINSQRETIKATAYGIHNITLTYILKNSFWNYLNSLGVHLSDIIDVYDISFEVVHNDSTIFVKGNKKTNVSSSLVTGDDFEIVTDTFTSAREMENAGPTSTKMYIQFLVKTRNHI